MVRLGDSGYPLRRVVRAMPLIPKLRVAISVLYPPFCVALLAVGGCSLPTGWRAVRWLEEFSKRFRLVACFTDFQHINFPSKVNLFIAPTTLQRKREDNL